MIKVRHDKKADAIYILLSNEPYSHGEDLDDERRIDYDVNGNPRGIELLCVSTGVITDNLPERAEIERILGERGVKNPPASWGAFGEERERCHPAPPRFIPLAS
jgi:uncharacterized protein YuzE